MRRARTPRSRRLMFRSVAVNWRAAPPNAGPGYYNGAPSRGALTDPNESFFSAFLREEIFAPEKLPGNLSI
ncbi:hypothetical protein BDY19DRAFT_1097928, partial [Irpex rosettiformis]